jgi:hypothetical protein
MSSPSSSSATFWRRKRPRNPSIFASNPVQSTSAAVRVEPAHVGDEVQRAPHHEAPREVDALGEHVGAEVLHEPHVEDRDLAGVEEEQVAGVKVGVHEAVLEAHLEEHALEARRELRVLARGQRVELPAAEELHRHHARGRQLGEHLGEAHPFDAGEERPEARVVVDLETQVRLVEDAGDELAQVATRVRQAGGGAPLEDAREEVEDRAVALDALADVGAQDLHRDLAPVLGARAVDLRDARGGDGLGVELRVPLFDGRAEVLVDDASDAVDGERGEAVLELPELVDRLGVEQVGPRAHHLPELHERRAERRHGPPEHAPAEARNRPPARLGPAHERRGQPAERVRRREVRDDDREEHEARGVAEEAHPPASVRLLGPHVVAITKVHAASRQLRHAVRCVSSTVAPVSSTVRLAHPATLMQWAQWGAGKSSMRRVKRFRSSPSVTRRPPS